MATTLSSAEFQRNAREIAAAIKVSPYDRAVSSLSALLVLCGSVVMLMFMVWIGSQVRKPKTGVPVTPIIVDEETGGFEHGVLGENIELPGPVTGDLGFGGEAPAPEMQQTLEAVASVIAMHAPQLDDPLPKEETKWSTGGVGGSRGTGNAPALGLGGGSGGGVRRSQRWAIEYQKGGSLAAYAAQLDFFKVELGIIGGSNEIEYAGNLAKPVPDKRKGPGDKEERLYFSWRDGTLQQADRELVARAGIQHGGRLVVQFYPPETENFLATIEMQYLQKKYPGRSIKTVRQTRFSVRPEGAGYTFVVSDQKYLGG